MTYLHHRGMKSEIEVSDSFFSIYFRKIWLQEISYRICWVIINLIPTARWHFVLLIWTFDHISNISKKNKQVFNRCGNITSMIFRTHASKGEKRNFDPDLPDKINSCLNQKHLFHSQTVSKGIALISLKSTLLWIALSAIPKMA